MTRVGIIGIGHGVFGRRSDATVQELAFEAFKAAMEDAGSKLNICILDACRDNPFSRSFRTAQKGL